MPTVTGLTPDAIPPITAALTAAVAVHKDAAAASQAAAAASQSAAAASAATAQNAIIGLYIPGGIAGNAVPATATAAGRYYRITSAGTSQGITWALGDLAVYNGTSGSWTQIAGNTVQPEDIQRLDAIKATRDYVQSDGATTNRRMEGVWGARANVAGSPMTFAAIVYVPTSNPAVDIYMFHVAALNGDPGPSSASPTLYCRIRTAGACQVVIRGAASTDFRSLSHATFRATYAGRWVRVVVSIPGDSAVSPTIWVNGVDVSAGFTASTGGMPPNWMPADLATTYFVAGLNWVAGVMPNVIPINRAWAQADVDWWQTTGRLPASDFEGGNAIPIVSPTLNNGGFETAGTGGVDVFATWVEFSQGTSAVVRDTTQSVSGTASCRLDIDASSSIAQVSLSASLIVTGRRYRVSFWARSDVAGTIVVSDVGGGVTIATLTTSWAFYSVDFVPTSTSPVAMFKRGGGQTSRSIWIDDVTITQLGALSIPTPQGNMTLLDGTANANQMLLVGGVPQTNEKWWSASGRTHISASGNQQLLGGSIVSTPERHRIDSVTVRNNGTSAATVSIGNVSGGAQYVSALSIPAGTTVDVPLLTRTMATANVWISSNVIGELAITVEGHRIAF
jgi:hypothetical protein